jgi:hypothetical protein
VHREVDVDPAQRPVLLHLLAVFLAAVCVWLGRLGARDAVQRGVGARERGALGLERAEHQLLDQLPREQLQAQPEPDHDGHAGPPRQQLEHHDDRGEQKDRKRGASCPAYRGSGAAA